MSLQLLKINEGARLKAIHLCFPLTAAIYRQSKHVENTVATLILRPNIELMLVKMRHMMQSHAEFGFM